MQKDGRVLFLTENASKNSYWNIPIANTTCLLLGNGTSITQAAMRMLASAGVLVGFCGGGGTPLLMATEIEWLTPQNEYRPTEYLQGWLSFWFDDKKRLDVAKKFQLKRIQYLQKVWSKDRDLKGEGFDLQEDGLAKAIQTYQNRLETSSGVSEILLHEAMLTKQLYRYASIATKNTDFRREHGETDICNVLLNHGNYLAYGMAATTLWVLGIPHGFAVMHGKTRRGALVFDVADLIKDAIVLPWAFVCAKEKMSNQDFRQSLLQKFTEHQSLDFLFNQVKDAALGSNSNVEVETCTTGSDQAL